MTGNSTITTALMAVRAALADVSPGPEHVTAADPATVTADWDADIAPGRDDKMRMVWTQVRAHIREAGVLHQLPQVLLVADDGACIELFGHGRTGIAVTIPHTVPGP